MNWADIQGQDRAVRLLEGALESGHVHHAYLLAGPEGTGREMLANVFAQAANCEAESPAQRPCGRCDNCKLVERGNFPDVSRVMPQSERVSRGPIWRARLRRRSASTTCVNCRGAFRSPRSAAAARSPSWSRPTR